MSKQGRYECRWCPARFVYFADMDDHANDEHPVEFERAITRPNLTTVQAARQPEAARDTESEEHG